MINLIKQLNNEGYSVKTPAEAKEVLSEKFADILERVGDEQLAYNELNVDYNGQIAEYFCYNIGDWSIKPGPKFEISKTSIYARSISDYYNQEDLPGEIEEICSFLWNRVSKDMSNAGIGPGTALREILSEINIEEGVFIIDGITEPGLVFIEEVLY